MPLLLTNSHFDVDAYLAHGGKLAELIIPAKEKRFWEARAEIDLNTFSADEQPSARTRFARLGRFCQCLGERVGDVRIGDILSEEEAQAVWQATATTSQPIRE